MTCATGGQCLDVPSPFQLRACILKQGMTTCPATDYTVQHTYYGSATDMRGCTACTCGTPGGADCNSNAHVELWSTSGCSAGGTLSADLHPLPASCVSPAPSALGGATLTTTPVGGSCPPIGGQPSGMVVPENAVTVCCTLGG
jgi:hypothetical protein